MFNKDKSNTQPKKPNSGGGQSLAIAAIIVGVIAIALSGYNTLTGATRDTVKSIVKNVSKEFQNIEMQLEQVTQLDPAVIDDVKKSVSKSVQAEIGAKIDSRISTIVDRKINDVEIRLNEKVEAVSAVPTNMQPIVDGLKSEEVLRMISDSARALELKDVNRFNIQNERFKLIESQVQRNSDRLLSASSNNMRETSKFTPRKRLKEFNIVPPALRDGTLFAIDAPRKNGKINNITLKKGERFRSKYGAHTVQDIIKTEDGYRLLISGGYFIDEKREEFTKQELAQMKAQSRKKSMSTPPQSKTTSKKTIITARDEGKLNLNGWYVVTTKPDTKEVVVYNPEKSVPMSLKANMHVSGVGTVKTIDFTTGRTCFDKYCIAGLQR